MVFNFLEAGVMNRNTKAIIALMILALALLVHLHSTFPDGLETVAQTLGVEIDEALWTGLMPGYNIPFLNSAYVSSSLTGVIGSLLVLAVAYLVGKKLTANNAPK